MRRILTAALCASLLAPGMAGAQGSDADQALDKAKRAVSDAGAKALCLDFGYQDNVAGTEEALRRAALTAMGAGVDPKVIKSALKTAGDAEVAKVKADIAAIFADENPEALKAATRRWAAVVSERCARLAAEPAAVAMIIAPPDYDRAAGLTAAVDAILESAGLASWQTPAMAANGDYLYDVGTCRRRLGARKADALAAPLVGKTKAGDMSAPREQRYYADSYQQGIEDAKDAGRTAEDCAKLTVAVPANPA